MKPRLAEPAQYAKTVHPWKHEVEENDIIVRGKAQLQSAVAIVSEADGMPLGLERPTKQIGGIRSIFGNKNSNASILRHRALISDDKTHIRSSVTVSSD